jgi:hypothetical protein
MFFDNFAVLIVQVRTKNKNGSWLFSEIWRTAGN